MTLYGPDGELLEATRDPALEGGWREGLPFGGLGGETIYGVSREQVRRQTRTAFFRNPLYGMGVEIAAALLIGDEFSYAPLNADETARAALDDLWVENSLDSLMPLLTIQYLLDGELCAVAPLEDPIDAATPFAHLDMDRGVRTTVDARGLASIQAPSALGGSLTWERGDFVFTAHNALWNDPRGWPPTMRAVAPAERALRLMDHRMNTHDLQARILGVQKVFVDRSDPNSRATFDHKASAYRRLPKLGGILTLAMVEGKDGKVISDSLEFMTPAAGASNAAEDLRALIRLSAFAILGLPEHYFGEGGTVTRTTADSMTLPAIRMVKRIQGAIRSHANRMYRLDLKRRYGPDRTYTITTFDVRDGGKTRVKRRKKVKADALEVPWIFPQITQASLDEQIKRAEAAARRGWASPQTLSGDLGFDPAEENDRMAAAGLVFGQAVADPKGKPEPQEDPNAAPQ